MNVWLNNTLRTISVEVERDSSMRAWEVVLSMQDTQTGDTRVAISVVQEAAIGCAGFDDIFAYITGCFGDPARHRTVRYGSISDGDEEDAGRRDTEVEARLHKAAKGKRPKKRRAGAS